LKDLQVRLDRPTNSATSTQATASKADVAAIARKAAQVENSNNRVSVDSIVVGSWLVVDVGSTDPGGAARTTGGVEATQAAVAHRIPAQFPAYMTIGDNATAIIMPWIENRKRGHRMRRISVPRVNIAARRSYPKVERNPNPAGRLIFRLV
jgi:hypothetical protein